MRTPLESLLNIKRWKEDEAKNQFALRLKELAVEEDRLLGFEDQYSAISRQLECDTDELVNVSEMVKLSSYLEQLLVRIHRQRQVIVEREAVVEAARRALVEASKEKKVFERLDEKKKEVIKSEFRRKEQIDTDEKAVTGHGRKNSKH